MKRGLKAIFASVLIILAVLLVNNEVFATGSVAVNVFSGSNHTHKVTTTEGETLIKKVVDPVLSVVRIVAIGLGIIVITFLGIKYMSSAPSEKANIKTQLITFTIGAIVVVSATSILKIILAFSENVTK